MKIKTLTLASLFIAATTLLTTWPSIPLFQGYFNLGDVMVMSMGYVLGMPYALLGGIGAALADILLGYGQYAVFTLIIKSIEAILIALYVKNSNHSYLVFVIAGTWMASGYALTDVFLSSSWAILIPSFGYNIIQGLSSAIIAFSLLPLLKRLKQNY
jgi:uncharacterized membrane protein